MNITTEQQIREAFAQQAIWCARLGSEFTAHLMEGMGKQLDDSTETGCKILSWPGSADAFADAVPLRLAGALHGLVRHGQIPGLAKHYPPNPLPDVETLTAAALDAVKEADDEIVEWLQHPPQTNEVARSAYLYPALMTVAEAYGLPIDLFEIGASAGLNLNAHQYSYKVGGKLFGQDSSPVILSPEWSGSFPTGRTPSIQSRRGCDTNPLFVEKASYCERLISYIWPDQFERMARTEAAIKIAQQDPPRIDKADAADWVEQVICEDAEPSCTRVLYHTIASQYFPDQVVRRISSHMETVGMRATHQTPLAWLALEQFEEVGPRLTLRIWPGDKTDILAKGDAHARRIEWLV